MVRIVFLIFMIGLNMSYTYGQTQKPKCLKGNCKNKPSKIQYPDGSIYSGDFHKKMKHGQGEMIYSNGETYKGAWINDSISGFGIYIFSDGTRYEGNWKNNKAEGFGKLLHPNGSSHSGEWKNNNEHGKGVFIDAKGNEYSGEWINGSMTGQFTVIYKKNKNIFQGYIEKGSYHGFGKFTYKDGSIYSVYEGNFKHGKKHGKGTMTYKCGLVYIGEWKDDQISGKGRFEISENARNFEHLVSLRKNNAQKKIIASDDMGWSTKILSSGTVQITSKSSFRNSNGTNWQTYAPFIHEKYNSFRVVFFDDKDIYYGTVTENGKMNGYGVIYYSNGDFYAGDFDLGSRTGKGVYYWNKDKAGRIKYEGEFQNSTISGYGKLTYSSGKIENGFWENGKYLGSKEPSLSLKSRTITFPYDKDGAIKQFLQIIPLKQKLLSHVFDPYFRSGLEYIHYYMWETEVSSGKSHPNRWKIGANGDNQLNYISPAVYRNNHNLNQLNKTYTKRLKNGVMELEEKTYSYNGSYSSKVLEQLQSFEMKSGNSILTYKLNMGNGSAVHGNGFVSFLALENGTGKLYLFLRDSDKESLFLKIDLEKESRNFVNSNTGYFGIYYNLGLQDSGRDTYIDKIYHAYQNDNYYYVFLGGPIHAAREDYILPIKIRKSDNKVFVMDKTLLLLLQWPNDVSLNGFRFIFQPNSIYNLPYSQGFANIYFTRLADYTDIQRIDIYNNEMIKTTSIDVSRKKVIKWIYELDNYIIFSGYYEKEGYVGYPNPWICVVNKRTGAITYEKVIPQKNGEIDYMTSDGNGNLIIAISAFDGRILDTDIEFKSKIIIDKLGVDGRFVNNLNQ